ncbi:sugar phosphate isomerase/epimerase [Deltaproteobacteria bacterium Smac51]|nr:sugar phosphate isomerase/epimerase [Deltaproteobacteria bacterium Smac51]
MDYKNRPLQLGMHSYTLHFFGLGESWGFGKDFFFEQTMDIFELMENAEKWELDGLQVTKVDLASTEPQHLAAVKKAAEKHGLFLEFNASFDAGSDSRVNCTIPEALQIGKDIGADLVKFSLDIKRPRKLYGSSMDPAIMVQLAEKYELFVQAIPMIEELDLDISIENHTDTFADEILWIVDKLNHSRIGVCVDTANPLQVMENPSYAMEKMLPRANCIHFSDDTIVVDPLGVHNIGSAHGRGSYDCAKMVREIREKSSLKRIILENEIAFKSLDEPIEEAREREMAACLESIRYLRNELKLGLRNR